MVNKFTQKAQAALSAALKTAEELGHSYIGTEHLLLGLITQKESIASRILTLKGVSEARLKKKISEHVGVGTTREISGSDMTPRLHFIIEAASLEARKNGVKYVGTEHLLAALLSRRDCVAIRLLESDGISVPELKAELSAYLSSAPQSVKESLGSEESAKKHKKSPLLSYGSDLTELARLGKTDPVLCRENETERLIRILCRRSKNNPCLIGEPGVGKTAVVEGLAERIVNGKVPAELLGKKIITLDISSMIAGAKFRGEFEDRMKSVIEEVRKDPEIILFVDEMHIMVGAGAAEGAIDASNILKPPLARGEIRMIGATTPDEYRTHIEKDAAFERRFQAVVLEEPSQEEAVKILSGIKENYEKHHGIRITYEAIEQAVRLSVRYIHDRFLPDKAIDLIDEAAAKLKLSAFSRAPSHLSEAQLEEMEQRKELAVKRGDIELASKISSDERELRRSGRVALLERTELPMLTSEDIAAIISEQTGIPVQSITSSDKFDLFSLEKKLSNKIIGQERAIQLVSQTIRRSRAGLCSPDRPSGSFLFLGSSGVGKTELCKALAEALFGSCDALIRLDMSEYMEKHSVSKLIGAPPGYVGYGEGGQLSEKVRRRPYSIILFDEIEKAHPDVMHLLLQILEDGKLTDSLGRTADFSSSIIIMTSNMISSDEGTPRHLGFGEAPVEEKKDLREHPKLKSFFRPEFLGRIDELILFSKLSENDLKRIAELMLDELKKRSAEAGIELEADSSVAELLACRCNELYKGLGARPLRREITDSIETPLADIIIKQDQGKRISIKISANKGTVNFSSEK